MISPTAALGKKKAKEKCKKQKHIRDTCSSNPINMLKRKLGSYVAKVTFRGEAGQCRGPSVAFQPIASTTLFNEPNLWTAKKSENTGLLVSLITEEVSDQAETAQDIS